MSRRVKTSRDCTQLFHFCVTGDGRLIIKAYCGHNVNKPLETNREEWEIYYQRQSEDGRYVRIGRPCSISSHPAGATYQQPLISRPPPAGRPFLVQNSTEHYRGSLGLAISEPLRTCWPFSRRLFLTGHKQSVRISTESIPCGVT